VVGRRLAAERALDLPLVAEHHELVAVLVQLLEHLGHLLVVKAPVLGAARVLRARARDDERAVEVEGGDLFRRLGAKVALRTWVGEWCGRGRCGYVHV
jgi:hypothetical protein